MRELTLLTLFAKISDVKIPQVLFQTSSFRTLFYLISDRSFAGTVLKSFILYCEHFGRLTFVSLEILDSYIFRHFFHATPQEFENGFTLKTHEKFSFHTTRSVCIFARGNLGDNHMIIVTTTLSKSSIF